MIAGAADSFTIVLEDQTRVSNSMLRKSKTVKLRSHANSFSLDHAKLEVETYYRELAADGSLGA
jgi:hypothetical protein